MIQTPANSPPDIVPDSESRGLVARLPQRVRDYVQLARFDRPIGSWLLFWPGAWAVALAGEAGRRWDLLLWLALGSIAMRGAGCVYNDIVDRDLDRLVARTALRPIASGRVSRGRAFMWLGALCLIGLIVLLQLTPLAAGLSLASLALVAAYPFMKRVTWWPQAWLGMVFSWAALVGWAEADGRFGVADGAAAGLLLYAGSILWVIGYDTIYALQDIEDDALAGVKSSARALGRHAKLGVAAFYGGALALWAVALWQIRPEPLALAALGPLALHLGWQVLALKADDAGDALAKFRANRGAGWLMMAACFVVGATA